MRNNGKRIGVTANYNNVRTMRDLNFCDNFRKLNAHVKNTVRSTRTPINLRDVLVDVYNLRNDDATHEPSNLFDFFGKAESRGIFSELISLGGSLW